MTGRAPAGRQPLRLIATDLDGTLLRSDGTVSNRTRDALWAAVDAGIEVVPATGRPHLWSEEVIERLPFIEHWVFANGSVTWHQGRGEVVRGWWLEAELARSLVERIRRAIPGATVAAEFDRAVVYEAGFGSFDWGVPVLDPADDLLRHLNGDVQKLLVLDADSDSPEELHRRVGDVVGDVAVTTFSGLAFVEVGAHLVSKANALQELVDDLGIDRREVVAFGDYYNDLEMLRWAGRSYAMGHAADDVREAADDVIGSNDDDAVAGMIEGFLEERSRS